MYPRCSVPSARSPPAAPCARRPTRIPHLTPPPITSLRVGGMTAPHLTRRRRRRLTSLGVIGRPPNPSPASKRWRRCVAARKAMGGGCAPDAAARIEQEVVVVTPDQQCVRLHARGGLLGLPLRLRAGPDPVQRQHTVVERRRGGTAGGLDPGAAAARVVLGLPPRVNAAERRHRLGRAAEQVRAKRT